MSYEIKQTMLLEIENETLKQLVKQLRLHIVELQDIITMKDLALFNHETATNKLLNELDNILQHEN
jgi:hypothetical protein